MNQVGFLIGSHVVYQHECLPTLLDSMRVNGIDLSRVVVCVNGSGIEHEFVQRGTTFIFRKPEESSHFAPVVDLDLGARLGITHWFYLNCTGRCGPRFKELVEAGYNPEADCTVAGPIVAVSSRGNGGRAINDLCMYRHDYLMSQKDTILGMTEMSTPHAHAEIEGVLYALAPKQAEYPNVSYHTDTPPMDIYGTGTPRITEHFPAVDWHRYKKNWGQLHGGTYKNARL